MKNKQLIKSVAIFSLLTFLMMLTLSQLALSAETATTAAAPALAPSEASIKTGNFYDCVHAYKANYFWGMNISKSLPQTIKPEMTVEQIMANVGPEEIVTQLVVDSAQKNIARLVSKSLSGATQEDFNLTKEFSHSIRLFGRYLRMRLNAQKNLTFTSPIEYQILFAPRLSDELMDRNKKGIVPRKSVYPGDRVVVADQIFDNDLFKSYDTEVSDNSLRGIQALGNAALFCGNKAGIHQAYPAAVLVRMTITPDIDSSKIMAQFVVGMPTGQNIPFEQSNEQITFQYIKLPETLTNKDLGSNVEHAYYQFPMAFVNVSMTLDSSTIPLQVRFGNIGTLSSEGFQRSSFADGGMDVLPKLQGIPGDKDSTKFMDNLKKRLLVEFNIYNLTLNIDYSKYDNKKAVEVTELDLLISAGLKRFGLTAGSFNVTSVNDQFKSEINKAIVQQIEAQEATVKKKIADAKGEVSKNTGLSSEEIDSMLSKIFSKTRTASAAGSK